MCELLFRATDSSIFSPGSALAAASETETSPTRQGWQQAGHGCPLSSAPLSSRWLSPTPPTWSGIVIDVSLCQQRIRDSVYTNTTYCCPWVSPGLCFSDFWFSHFLQKGYSYCCSHHFCCSTRQQNIQWCPDAEQIPIKTEHEPVPRSEGTQVGRSQRSWVPLSGLFKHGVPRDAGAEAVGSSFTHLTHLTDIAFIHC